MDMDTFAPIGIVSAETSRVVGKYVCAAIFQYHHCDNVNINYCIVIIKTHCPDPEVQFQSKTRFSLNSPEIAI